MGCTSSTEASRTRSSSVARDSSEAEKSSEPSLVAVNPENTVFHSHTTEASSFLGFRSGEVHSGGYDTELGSNYSSASNVRGERLAEEDEEDVEEEDYEDVDDERSAAAASIRSDKTPERLGLESGPAPHGTGSPGTPGAEDLTATPRGVTGRRCERACLCRGWI